MPVEMYSCRAQSFSQELLKISEILSLNSPSTDSPAEEVILRFVLVAREQPQQWHATVLLNQQRRSVYCACSSLENMFQIQSSNTYKYFFVSTPNIFNTVSFLLFSGCIPDYLDLRETSCLIKGFNEKSYQGNIVSQISGWMWQRRVMATLSAKWLSDFGVWQVIERNKCPERRSSK